jgi:hypothetical protein
MPKEALAVTTIYSDGSVVVRGLTGTNSAEIERGLAQALDFVRGRNDDDAHGLPIVGRTREPR